MTRGKKPERTSAAIFLDEGVVWTLGGREYHQKALSIRGLSKVLNVLSSEIGKLVQTPFFAAFSDLDWAKVTSQQIAELSVAMLAAVPELLPMVLASFLGAPDDAEYLADNVTPVRALKIFEVFLDQNEPEALVQTFFGLGRRIKSLIPTETTAPA